jgi:hypothetical protein
MGGKCSVVYPGGANREKCWQVDSFNPNRWGLYNLRGNAWRIALTMHIPEMVGRP